MTTEIKPGDVDLPPSGHSVRYGGGVAARAVPDLSVSQSLINGWRRTLPAALAPLISDGPIIALCVLVVSQIPAGMEKALYAVSGAFIIYLAFGSYTSWRRSAMPVMVESTARQSVWKAALMNVLNPGPYIFWTLVSGPILVSGWRESPVKGIGFLAGFYVTMVAVGRGHPRFWLGLAPRAAGESHDAGSFDAGLAVVWELSDIQGAGLTGRLLR